MVILGRYQSGQMGQTVNLLVFTFGGSNPSLPTLLNVKNIKCMTLEIRNYRDYKGEKCLQILPEINYWYKHLDPDYTNALFIGWLWWGICIHFDK